MGYYLGSEIIDTHIKRDEAWHENLKEQYQKDIDRLEQVETFLENVFELAFGEDVNVGDRSLDEVFEKLKENSDKALRYEQEELTVRKYK